MKHKSLLKKSSNECLVHQVFHFVIQANVPLLYFLAVYVGSHLNLNDTILLNLNTSLKLFLCYHSLIS